MVGYDLFCQLQDVKVAFKYCTLIKYMHLLQKENLCIHLLKYEILLDLTEGVNVLGNTS